MWVPRVPTYSSPLPYNNTTRNLKQKGNMGSSETGNRITPPLPSLYLMCTTFSNGCHGSHNDEERSEMRYVMRIAGPRESSKFWTHIVLPGYAWLHARLSVLVPHSTVIFFCNMSEYGTAFWQRKAVFKSYVFWPYGSQETRTHLLWCDVSSCARTEWPKSGSMYLVYVISRLMLFCVCF